MLKIIIKRHTIIMARKSRIHFMGAVYHVILRGNRGQQIFYTDNDRIYFYSLLEEGIKRFGYQVHAFCLMDNHVHLALQVSDIPLSKGMQNLGFRYARWINDKKNQIGHLFQGRYKAILVDIDHYLLQLIRYIHLNPIRANLVGHIDAYKWSSHHDYLGSKRYSWLTTEWVLSIFAEQHIDAIRRYNHFMQSNLDGSIQKKFSYGNQNGLPILGEKEFIGKLVKSSITISNNLLSLELLVQHVCDYYSIDVSSLKSNSRIRFNAKIRVIIAFLARKFAICTITTVSVYFNRDVAVLNRGIHLLSEDSEVQKTLDHLSEKIKSIIGV
jgi:putative transposase